MTRDEAKQLLPIITAFANGDAVQESSLGSWYDLDTPAFIREPEYYRIKPKPREFWAPSHAMETSEDLAVSRWGQLHGIIHVKEVV